MLMEDKITDIEMCFKKFYNELSAIEQIVFLHTGIKMDENERYRDYVNRALSKSNNTALIQSYSMH